MPDTTDPTHATALELKRKTFIGLSASAVAAMPVATALAAGEDYGKPHPPIVSERDPAISVQRVTLTSPDQPIPAYAAYPKHATPTTPGVVVVHAIWGVDAQIRDVVRRLAKAGY